jgi:hypothetical protein
MTANRVSANCTDVVVNPKLRARQSLKQDAESSRRYVEAARLKPNAIRIRDPVALIMDIDVRNEVAAISSIRIETIIHAAKRCDRHIVLLLCGNQLAPPYARAV